MVTPKANEMVATLIVSMDDADRAAGFLRIYTGVCFAHDTHSVGRMPDRRFTTALNS